MYAIRYARLTLGQTCKTCNPSVPIGTQGADSQIAVLGGIAAGSHHIYVLDGTGAFITKRERRARLNSKISARHAPLAPKEPQESHQRHIDLSQAVSGPPHTACATVRERRARPAALLLHIPGRCLGRQFRVDVVRERRPAPLGGARGVGGLLRPTQLEDLVVSK